MRTCSVCSSQLPQLARDGREGTGGSKTLPPPPHTCSQPEEPRTKPQNSRKKRDPQQMTVRLVVHVCRADQDRRGSWENSEPHKGRQGPFHLPHQGPPSTY